MRLYLLSTIAGALEPCGCSKDQLGGISHLAAFLSAEREKVPGGLVLGAVEAPGVDGRRLLDLAGGDQAAGHRPAHNAQPDKRGFRHFALLPS